MRKWLYSLRVPFIREGAKYEPLERIANSPGLIEKVAVLAITASGQERRVLKTIAKSQDWDFLYAGTWAEALQIVKNHRTGVVLLDRGRLGTEWRDSIALLLHPSQRCCVILLTPTAPDRFCQEFIQEGDYTILKTPLDESEVADAVRLAWAFWKTCIVRAYRY